jgi:hypoxanthine phosphoribosyltransferase
MIEEEKQIERVVVSEDAIAEAVGDLAGRVGAVYSGVSNVLGLVILEGARRFGEDLLGRLDFAFEIEFVRASSYKGVSSKGSVDVAVDQRLADKIKGRHVLLIDDIYDTGLTLSSVMEWVWRCGAASVRTCVLLEKAVEHTRPVEIDFLGLRIENAFVVGYGLDYNGRFRELPCIQILNINSK